MENTFITTLFICFLSLSGFSQIHPLEKVRDKSESIQNVKNEQIRREIETFNVAKYLSVNRDTFQAPTLAEIPLLACSEDFISFESGNWISTNLHVSIESKPFAADSNQITFFDSTDWVTEINGSPVWGAEGAIPKNQITRVEFWFNIHAQQELPASALTGLYEPNFSSGGEYRSWEKGKKTKPEKQFCKIYRSEDKKRVYIYMKNGSGTDGYEVTWVIQDQKYLMRVIDLTF